MKQAVAVALLLFAAVPSAVSLTLEANEIGTSVHIVTHWLTDWGSYDRDYYRGKRIRVLVRDVSRKVPEVDVDVYFIARSLPSRQKFIYGHHRETVKPAGLIEVEGAIEAPDLKGSVLRLASLGEVHSSGAEVDGWIVVGKVGEKTFGTRASNQTLLEIAEENDRQSLSLAKLIATYERQNDRSSGRRRDTARAPSAPAEVPKAVAPERATTSPAVPQPPAPIRALMSEAPKPSAAPTMFSTPQPAGVGSATTVTIVRAVEIRRGATKITIPRGAKLPLVSIAGDVVQVRFENGSEIIPLSATDMASH